MLIAMPMNMLSGSSTPLGKHAAVSAHHHAGFALDAFVSVAQAILYRGAGFNVVWQQFLAVAVIAARYSWPSRSLASAASPPRSVTVGRLGFRRRNPRVGRWGGHAACAPPRGPKPRGSAPASAGGVPFQRLEPMVIAVSPVSGSPAAWARLISSAKVAARRGQVNSPRSCSASAIANACASQAPEPGPSFVSRGGSGAASAARRAASRIDRRHLRPAPDKARTPRSTR